ncbi:unnamed protein product [Acanthosepion pharaonis]|uniref:Maturase K n=1 Tax=Acanthosepion pharaonis TaxID=158019 RepID=A0A812EIQ8_ACAPH|nr:unnamed protein product [Sepia pharaonis]
MRSQIPSSNHALLSLFAFWNSFLHQATGVSQIPSSNQALLFVVLPFELFSLHQSQYESLKFRHLITLYFRCCLWNSFSLHQSHYESQILSSNPLPPLVCLPFELYFLHFESLDSIKAIMTLFPPQIPSSNHALLSLVPLVAFQNSRFHHLITLCFSLVPFELFPSSKAIMSLLKFRHLITLYFRWLLELFSLHQPL